MSTRWAEKYVGLPFVDGGRDFRGVDCWGLVRLVLKYERAVEVPSYGEISAMELMQIAQMVGSESSREPWRQVQKPHAFDVAVMHRRRAPIHVGIMVTSELVLHVEKTICTVMVPLNSPGIVFRYASIFRHRDLLNEA